MPILQSVDTYNGTLSALWGGAYISKEKTNLTYSQGVKATWTDIPDTAGSIPITNTVEVKRSFASKVIGLFK